ncbi:uncharacterized protein LOC105839445 [Monomorium pharaonis]|uniref:uncharacterized protein LOC105839445 n=1 Tax=Monomorium pharaonis TaxID=307658 RepID=UPI00063EF41A|nr:uncharacterized protein LOC105839445 [Monomorium pharaonis]XP_028045437.1 uncharacterized protein LOC105839445 [Monomorium pharaonis]XP_028045439.1 uncharacterized protein LOC105839445 [Monomorium pharaonis]XP_028045440.1 uncharacterized protein LOC105839445 [Monomorium pharaonis]XP_036140937.1 uncharacterized protein LOC105839445 [Monomorium pharaonis]
MVAFCYICKIEQNSIQDPDRTFHRFPKNESLRLKWCEAIKKNVHNTYICSMHFKPEDYRNHEDPNLKKKLLKPSAIPSIMLSKESILESIENASSSSIPIPADISIKNKNKSKHFELEDCENHEDPNLIEKKLKPTVPSITLSTELESTKNTSSSNNVLLSTDILTDNSSNKSTIEDSSTLQSMKKQRYQDVILGTVRKTDFINKSAWLRFQKYVNGLKKQHKFLLHKNRRIYFKLNNFKNLLKKLRRNNLLAFNVYKYLDKRIYQCYSHKMKHEYLYRKRRMDKIL